GLLDLELAREQLAYTQPDHRVSIDNQATTIAHEFSAPEEEPKPPPGPTHLRRSPILSPRRPRGARQDTRSPQRAAPGPRTAPCAALRAAFGAPESRAGGTAA